MSEESISKRDERNTFWFLMLFAAPILAVLVVSGYGFLIFRSSLADALVRGNGFPTRLSV